MMGSLVALVALGGVLAACGLGGGGSSMSDCSNDISDPDQWGVGASASYAIATESCSNNGASDTDQYLYPEATEDQVFTCTIDENGAGSGVEMLLYRDPGNGGTGALLADVVCIDGGGTSYGVDQAALQPGDHILIEVRHNGTGSRATITTTS